MSIRKKNEAKQMEGKGPMKERERVITRESSLRRYPSRDLKEVSLNTTDTTGTVFLAEGRDEHGNVPELGGRAYGDKRWLEKRLKVTNGQITK